MPFRAEHLATLEIQAAQAQLQHLLADDAYRRALEQPGRAGTALVASKVVGCAGMIPQHAGLVMAWALLGGDLPRAGP